MMVYVITLLANVTVLQDGRYDKFHLTVLIISSVFFKIFCPLGSIDSIRILICFPSLIFSKKKNVFGDE